MKIVMLCDLFADGLQYQENLLAKYYAKHGHSVTVVAATYNSALDYQTNRYDRQDPGGEHLDGRIKVIKLPYSLNLMNRLRRFPGVAAILRREQPDLIFVHDIHLNLPEAAAYRRSHPACRIIMDYHADYSNSGRSWLSVAVLHKIIRKAILYRSRRWIDRIYPVVPASAAFLHEVYGLPFEELELLPLGADTDLAKSTKAAQAGLAVRETYGIPRDAVVVFTGGKLTPAKKTHLLLEAVRLIADPRLHVIVVGDATPEDAAYKRRLEALGASLSTIHFAGWVDGSDVYRFMDACDFAVFPASQSVLWQQALSMGLPLIVGQVGAQDCSYMNLYGNIITVKECDIRAEVLAREIRGILGDPAFLERCQAAALRVADELLSYDAIVARTLRAN